MNSIDPQYVICKATKDDFEEILPLLVQVNPATSVERTDWINIFNQPWSGEDYCGWKVLLDGKIVGFMGIVFAHRMINGKMCKFANRSSTIIGKEHRGKGIGRMLINKVEELREYTVTTFSGIDSTIKILKKLGHVEYESVDVILLPLIPISTLFTKYHCIALRSEILKHLNEEDRKIFNDHEEYKCKFMLFKVENSYCFVIFTKVKKKKLSMGRVHYISNRVIFNKYLSTINFHACLNFGIIGLFFPKREYYSYHFPVAINYKLPTPRVFKSPDGLTADDIDSLYSELILLNL